jgi:hypothetical protein
MVFAVQVDGGLQELGFDSRLHAEQAVERALDRTFGGEASLAYVFVDDGAFEKRLTFYDPVARDNWSGGVRSSSVILYGFLRRKDGVAKESARRSLDALREDLGIPSIRFSRALVGEPPIGDDAQRQLDLPAS